MTEITADMLKQIPMFQHLGTFAATLEMAKVQVDATTGTTVTIEFADQSERDAFLEAVKFVQTAHKGAK